MTIFFPSDLLLIFLIFFRCSPINIRPIHKNDELTEVRTLFSSASTFTLNHAPLKFINNPRPPRLTFKRLNSFRSWSVWFFEKNYSFWKSVRIILNIVHKLRSYSVSKKTEVIYSIDRWHSYLHCCYPFHLYQTRISDFQTQILPLKN